MSHRIVIAELESISPYSQSRQHEAPKLEKEGADAYDKRTWPQHLHTDEAGFVVIPPMSLKNALDTAVSRLGLKIPGRGNNQYTKYFEGGVLCIEKILLLDLNSKPVAAKDVPGGRYFLNADGRRGGAKRVWRTYPEVAGWRAQARFEVVDDTIPQDIFERALSECGKFVGIGRFRPEKRGFYGRFIVKSVKWS